MSVVHTRQLMRFVNRPELPEPARAGSSLFDTHVSRLTRRPMWRVVCALRSAELSSPHDARLSGLFSTSDERIRHQRPTGASTLGSLPRRRQPPRAVDPIPTLYEYGGRPQIVTPGAKALCQCCIQISPPNQRLLSAAGARNFIVLCFP
jgi:hypothetical protein